MKKFVRGCLDGIYILLVAFLVWSVGRDVYEGNWTALALFGGFCVFVLGMFALSDWANKK